MRALIATATAGAGHLQAAAALHEAWLEQHSANAVEVVDVLDFVPRFYRKAYAEGYLEIVKRSPELYGLVFRLSDHPNLMRRLEPLRKVLSRVTARRFVDHVKRFRPDVLFCPHFLPIEMVRDLRRKLGSALPYLVSVVTDFHAHAFWIQEGIDLYCVAAEATKRDLLNAGVPARRIAVTGIPISARFRKRQHPAGLRKQLKLSSGIPTLLLLSGGFGMGPVAQILDEVERLRSRVQILVVAGRNKALKKALEVRTHRHPTTVFGFVTNMEELMTVSDLLITKAGGLTTSEALALGKPLLIVDPIPGQETANADFLIKHGAAVQVTDRSRISRTIQRLLASGKLAKMSAAAKSLGKPRAAIAVLREVAKRQH
jgi:processive 1,2-diacylglycerol beta-glucosyltransferase